jgi:hypothetical protein
MKVASWQDDVISYTKNQNFKMGTDMVEYQAHRKVSYDPLSYVLSLIFAVERIMQLCPKHAEVMLAKTDTHY